MFLTEEQYQRIIGMMEGKIRKSPLLLTFNEWAKKEMDVAVYDIICTELKTGRPKLEIVLWDDDAKKKMMYFTETRIGVDEEKQKRFLDEFCMLSERYQVNENFRKVGNILVGYETIRDEIQSRVIKRAAPEIGRIHHPDLWKIEIICSSVHFFYETEEQTEKHDADGTSEKLRKKCNEIITKHDRHGAFRDGASCVFTSHQTFDEKYKGSMFYYTR